MFDFLSFVIGGGCCLVSYDQCILSRIQPLPCFICSPRANFHVTPGILSSYFCIPTPVVNRTCFLFFCFFLVLVLWGLLGLHRTDQLLQQNLIPGWNVSIHWKIYLAKFTQEVDNLNRLTSSKETEYTVTNFQKQKAQGQMGSLTNSTRYLRKKLHQISIISFIKWKQKEYSNWFYETSIPLIPKTR